MSINYIVYNWNETSDVKKSFDRLSIETESESDKDKPKKVFTGEYLDMTNLVKEFLNDGLHVMIYLVDKATYCVCVDNHMFRQR